MGNRAVIKMPSGNLGIYLHWNGGPESIFAFLEAARRYKLRCATQDEGYAAARLCQIIGNFFGDTLSLGVGPLESLDCDNMDNGTYVMGEDFLIVDRLHSRGADSKATSVQELSEHDRKRYQDILDAVLVVNDPIFKREA